MKWTRPRNYSKLSPRIRSDRKVKGIPIAEDTNVYLRLCIGHGGRYHSYCQHCNAEYLHSRISFTPEISNHHSGYASPASEYDVDRNRDIEAKSVVVEDINTEEEYDVRKPPVDRYRGRLEEIRWVSRGEMERPRTQSDERELCECNEETLSCSMN